ncbi:hypothetical protein F8196_04740 [Corynebacterium matruchotii]|nr:hypothetical protein F8196_04740 [Corynebacterium matruchotii]
MERTGYRLPSQFNPCVLLSPHAIHFPRSFAPQDIRGHRGTSLSLGSMIAELGFVMCYIVAPAFANVLRDATIQLQLSNYATSCCKRCRRPWA